jgi:Uncharacterised protein family UPF0102
MTASDGPDSSPTHAPRPERQAAFHLGISAESRAAAFLIAKGFRILARRWRSPVGEIDIVGAPTPSFGLRGSKSARDP